jgi:cysteine-rich repeat protein
MEDRMTKKQLIGFALPFLLSLNACKDEPPPPPAEDGTCAAPFSVDDPSNGTAGDSTGAANQMDGSCLGGGAPDVVFSVTPTGNLLEVTLTPAAADLGVFVIPATSCVGDGSVADDEIECEDVGVAGDPENLTATVTPGQEILVIVSGFQGDAGAFTLDVSSRNVVCGDGQLDGTEECDDGNQNAGDGCDATCVQEDGFNCDTGVEPTVCVAIVCGDGLVEFFDEECDDGNLTNGDGCDNTCAEEDGFSCSGEPSVCELTCGDGFVDFDEECDDDNNTAGDGCAADCTVETNFACSGDPSVCANIVAECAAANPVITAGDTSLGTASDKFEPFLCGAGAKGGENLFSFNATTATVTITVTPNDANGVYDPVVYAFLGNCADTTELDCEDTTFGGEEEVLVIDGTDGLPANGGALTIVVDSFSDTSEGAYTITVVGQ